MNCRITIAAGLGLLACLIAFPMVRLLPARAAGAPSDDWVRTTAKIAILTSIGTLGSTVQVDTRNATITLYGKVASAEDVVDAEKSARGVEGVREVRNLLMIVPVISPVGQRRAEATPDSEIQTRVAVAVIAAGLQKDSPLHGSDVSVPSVDNGTVFLAGTASLAGQLRALETAKDVRGVRAVRSAIRSSDAAAVYRARFLGP